MGNGHFSEKDYWRAVILYGLNTATYKMALGHCLSTFVKQNETSVTMYRLAEAFFELYLERLRNGKPQLATPNRTTVMERIVELYTIGKITKEEAIDRVEKEAFGDVIHRFHTVNNVPLPVKFYERNERGLIITDSAFKTFDHGEGDVLLQELTARWDLLEAAFEIRKENSILSNDIRRFYLEKGYERKNITHTQPVLYGYQNDVCFYCGERMVEKDIHVDHVIPRQLVYHDEIWNLVLAHKFCNEQKSDSLPGNVYIEKLFKRNEHFIASNHPIKSKLICQLGATPDKRRAYIYRVYNDAKYVIGYTWEGIRGYNPRTDEFYKTFIRSISH